MPLRCVTMITCKTLYVILCLGFLTHNVHGIIPYNFHNQTHYTIHTCTSDFREFSHQILYEDVLLQTSRYVCKEFGLRNWRYGGNLTQMPKQVKDVYNLFGPVPSSCAIASFQARVVVPGLLRHIVPHAQLKIEVYVCVRGAHIYHTVYISECPLFGTIVFSHDISAWTVNREQASTRKALVITDAFMKIPWIMNSLGSSIVNDVTAQSIQDVDVLVDSMCFNMSARHNF